MAARTLINDLKKHIGEIVTLNGFVQVLRDQKSVQFIVLRDHTGLVQVVIERTDESKELNELVSTITRESTVEITGIVVDNPRVKLGQVEVLLKSIKILSLADPVLPIDISGHTTTDIDKRMDWRFLDLRRQEGRFIFEIQTTIEQAMRDFWLAEGFVEIHSPKIMGSPSEGGAELFSMEYFGQTASLAQSPQFYKQMAMAAGLDRVFEIGPAFRADPSFTPRHATEFTSIDMEFSWITSHFDVMDLEERWLQQVLASVKEKHGEKIKEIFGVEIDVPALPFPKFTMAEAQEILKSEGHTAPGDSKKGDIDPLGERVLCDYVKREFGHEFVFVTDYPIEVRPFYHMRYEDQPHLTKSFDLLWKWQEITTGAQREHRYDVLVRQAQEKGVPLDSVQFYLDFFKYGCPPHGGLGFGLARLLTVMLNQPGIREVTFLHRSPTRLIP